jgi:lactoylglutathione lyase
MFIEHMAIWCKDLEAMKAFYCKWFNATPNTKYVNPTKNFSSYFLSFTKGPRLELMQMPGIPSNENDVLNQYTGLIHFAISVGSAEEVNLLTEAMRKGGINVLDEPRFTGDGYYESVVADPEGNRIEITI